MPAKAIIVVGSVTQTGFSAKSDIIDATSFAFSKLHNIYGFGNVIILKQPPWAVLRRTLLRYAVDLETFVFIGHGDPLGGMIINDLTRGNLVPTGWIRGMGIQINNVLLYSCYQGRFKAGWCRAFNANPGRVVVFSGRPNPWFWKKSAGKFRQFFRQIYGWVASDCVAGMASRSFR